MAKVDFRLRQYGYHLKLVPRSQQVRGLEGYYTLHSNNAYYAEWLGAQSKLAFGRWLLKAKQLSPDEVARVCKQVAESSQTVKISGRFGDIIRMAMTKHFVSCAAPGRLGAMCARGILRDAKAGIVFERDRSGQFKGRVVFRVMEDKSIQFFRPYGTLSSQEAEEALRQVFAQKGFVVRRGIEDTVVYYRLPLLPRP